MVGFAPDTVDYQAGWDLQRHVHAEVAAGERPDTILLLEHTAVYTAGKRTEPHERPKDGTPVVDVDRGGKITWHGPGQLTGYPIVRLPAPIDVVNYVRQLEEMMIRVCADFGVVAGRREGQSGTWIADAGVTSLTREVGREITVADVLPSVQRHLTDAIGSLRPNARAVVAAAT